MFARRRTTSKTSEFTSEVPTSFVTWQKLLATLPALATMGFLIWPRYGTPELIKFEPLDNISTNSITSTQTNLLTVETTTVRKNFASSLDQRSSYCQITACRAVSCSIPKTLDAANVASEFIETVFKAECKNADSVKLSLNDCRFSANSLRKNWLATNLPIEELTLDGCSLREIEDDAFDQSIFEETRALILLNNKLASLRKAAFRRLTSLEELNIRENFIKQIEFNLLENAAGSLSTLDLSGAIDDPLVLRNITGGSVLKKLRTLSLRENFISEITDESFQGAPKVQSLYLTNSRIDSLSLGSLEPMALSIEQVFINGNRISSLPEGLLDSVLQGQKSFHLTLDNNPWNCDCRLQWMQDLVNARPNVITNVPVCSSPPENADKSFITAEFCLSNSTGAPVTKPTTGHSTQQTETRTTTTTNEPEKIAVTCTVPISEDSGSGGLRKLLSTDLQFPPRVPGFFVHSVTDKSIVLKLPNLEEGLTLLWFYAGNANRSISCVKRARHFYQVRNIDPATTYTICVLNDNEDTVSPLNCLAATTLPDSSRTWLKNANTAQAIVVLTLVPIAVFFIGIFSTFLVIRKYPSLLRGSKRVMLVKKNLVDAIVLPKGVNLEEKRQRRGSVPGRSNKLEDGYITPLPPTPAPPPRVARISRASLQSDWHSYVSEVEPTETQLASWGLARLHSDLEDQEADAPPLPPCRLNSIPSLSLSVEAKTEGADYGMSAV